MSDERQASRYAKELVRFVVDEACHLSEETDEQCGMLLGYIASLEADRARLDWMEAHPHGCAVRHPGKGMHAVLWIVPDYAKHANNHRGPTLRAAIDAAMLLSPCAPTQGGA